MNVDATGSFGNVCEEHSTKNRHFDDFTALSYFEPSVFDSAKFSYKGKFLKPQ